MLENVKLLQRLLRDKGLVLETFYASPGERPRSCAVRLRKELDKPQALRVIVTSRDCAPKSPEDHLRQTLTSLVSSTRLRTPPVVHYELPSVATEAQAVIARLGLLGEGGTVPTRSPLASPCRTGKKKYEDAEQAEGWALVHAARHNNPIPQRSYHCNCGWFHLTTQL